MAATSVTESYDAVLTSTLRKMSTTLSDNIHRGNKVVSFLMSRGRVRRLNGGERIQTPLMYGMNSGADVYSGYGITQTTPQDGITSAFWPWSQMSVPISISGLEEMQNMGESAILDLLAAKTQQAQSSGIQLLNRAIVTGRLSSGATGDNNQFVAIVGSVDNGASGPLPLPALIDSNASRSVAIGSINGNTEAWWRNQSREFSGSTFIAFKQQRGRIYNDCSKGVNGNPDLIVSDQLVWELYMNSLANQERYYVTNQRDIDVLGGVSEELLRFRGAINIWDEVVPDVGDDTATPETYEGAGDAVGTFLQSGAHGTEFHLNSQAMEYVVHSRRNWTPTPFVKPANQDSRVSHLLWMGQMTVNNRRKLGVMWDIDNSIVS